MNTLMALLLQLQCQVTYVGENGYALPGGLPLSTSLSSDGGHVAAHDSRYAYEARVDSISRQGLGNAFLQITDLNDPQNLIQWTGTVFAPNIFRIERKAENLKVRDKVVTKIHLACLVHEL